MVPMPLFPTPRERRDTTNVFSCPRPQRRIGTIGNPIPHQGPSVPLVHPPQPEFVVNVEVEAEEEVVHANADEEMVLNIEEELILQLQAMELPRKPSQDSGNLVCILHNVFPKLTIT